MSKITETGAVDQTFKVTYEQLVGTGFRGEVVATYQQLMAVFGEPDSVKGAPESLYEWLIDTPAGVAAVYDQSHQSFDLRLTGRPWGWHVGSRTDEAIGWIQRALAGDSAG